MQKTTTFTNLGIRGAELGTGVLVAGAVTIANASVTANSLVFTTRQAVGGTVGHLSVVVTAGTGFVITSSSGTDTSTVAYVIIEDVQ